MFWLGFSVGSFLSSVRASLALQASLSFGIRILLNKRRCRPSHRSHLGQNFFLSFVQSPAAAITGISTLAHVIDHNLAISRIDVPSAIKRVSRCHAICRTATVRPIVNIRMFYLARSSGLTEAGKRVASLLRGGTPGRCVFYTPSRDYSSWHDAPNPIFCRAVHCNLREADRYPQIGGERFARTW